MKEIPTAESFYESIDENYEMLSDIPHIHRTMIEFAKLHVEAQAEAIHARTCGRMFESNEGHLKAVVNAYPLDNIK